MEKVITMYKNESWEVHD